MWPVALSAFGQTADFKDSRVPMTELAGPWRFHAGDNPTWENTDASDSGWSLLYAGKSWDEQGYKGYSGVAWYRLRLLDASDGGPLAFYLPSVDESCQVFVNGRLIGQVGSFPPHPRYITVFSAFSVGLFANAVLPGRIGELARVAVLTRKLRLRGRENGIWAALVGTVFAHRLFDLVPGSTAGQPPAAPCNLTLRST